jgi:hypothetical protein
MMKWDEFSIGWFRLNIGLVSVLLVYVHGKGYRVTVEGFFNAIKHPGYVKNLTEAKQTGIELMVKVLHETIEKAEKLSA